jgi:hypothetical protein
LTNKACTPPSKIVPCRSSCLKNTKIWWPRKEPIIFRE